jgi:UDP-2-acetamido-3-amino-2,3-dideoxy-glucuronate N-acetyltransferase
MATAWRQKKLSAQYPEKGSDDKEFDEDKRGNRQIKGKSSMTEKNVAVIGAGYWGKNLVRNFHELGVLKTICDASLSIRKHMGDLYPDVALTDNFDAVLNDTEVQAVVISAPAVFHFDLARKALLAGKHVFVEKPLSLTYNEGEALVKVAKEKQRIIFVGHILNYHPAVIQLKEMINKGKIGRLQYIYSRRLSLGKIRREENILWSFAPHDISLILSLTGEEPSYIDSVGSNFLHAKIADVTMTNMKFPSGIGAHIFVSWLNPFKEQRLVIVGDQGMFVFDDTQPVEQKLVLFPHTIHWQDGVPIPQKAESIPIDLKPIWQEPLKAECEAFLKAVQTGDPSLTSGEEGLRVLRILELSQQSIEAKERAGTAPSVSLPSVIPAIPSVIPAEAGIQKSEMPSSVFPDVFIHPTAIIDDNVTIGKGTKIWHFCHVLSGSKIGESCNIGQNCVIGPDITIGNKCKIQNNVSVYKGVTLEDGVFCGPSMVFTNIYNPRAEISKMDQVRPTLVKRGATLGANCTIICGHLIGSYAFIGAGTVVTKNVPDHALMVGNPAKQIALVCECGGKLNESYQCGICNKEYDHLKHIRI